jgi:tRNA dimethylallyltransferase
VLGPTGVGKSDSLAAVLDNRFELISADSMQVYRGMDIGTAKPDSFLRALFPHHLVDIMEPSQQFNAGEFVKRADAAAREIHGRGHIPVVSGGTGFYLRNFIFGLPESPPGNPEIREELKRDLARDGLAVLAGRLAREDPIAAKRVHAADTYRVLRALEVHRVSGRSLFSFNRPTTPRLGYRFLVLGLQREKEDLSSRIDERVERMFERGLLDEMRTLMDAGFSERDPGMRGIGYREFFPWRKGCLARRCLVESIQQDSRKYAKRQFTFFRAFPHVQWLHAADTDALKRRIMEFLDLQESPSEVPEKSASFFS